MSNEHKTIDDEYVLTANKKEYQFYIDNNDLNKKTFNHKNNKVSTTKYNIITFLPKALLFQFFRLANVYFLIIAIIQCIKIISPLDPATAVAPLAFVLTVSLIREAIEDYMRYKFDSSLNNEKVTVYRHGAWVEAKSETLQLGELIVVRDDCSFPADLVIVESSGNEGMCFIETGTLDGEKAPKNKTANIGSLGVLKVSEDEYRNGFKIGGTCKANPPSQDLNKLEGRFNIQYTDQSGHEVRKQIPLDGSLLLPKGALLRMTKWIIGFVVYAGHNTKLIKNSGGSRVKYSYIERLMSRLLVFILLLQMIFCIVCAGLNNLYWYRVVRYHPYLPGLSISAVVDSIIAYFSYLLLLNTMIPISLIISLELTKIVQGLLMHADAQMYSFVRKQYVKPQSISLNEELGSVNFIFSDKTGTLTRNKMVLKYTVIGDVCYGYDDGHCKTEDINKMDPNIVIFKDGYFSKFVGKTQVTYDKTKYNNFVLKSNDNPKVQLSLENEANVIEEFWKALALCNEIFVTVKEGKEVYTATSSEDVELVRVCALQGYVNKKVTQTKKLVEIAGEMKEFEILNVLEFTSDRKKASIIVRDNGVIKLYIKGADNVITSGLIPGGRNDILDQVSTYVKDFSLRGYRCLYAAMRIFDEDEYQRFNEQLQTAKGAMGKEKEDLMKEACANFESDLHLIGGTIIEDRLQDDVPNTIRDLRLAGIRIWMLTGDKLDTAYNIALSCNLISYDLENFMIEGSKKTIDQFFHEFEKYVKKQGGKKLAYSILLDNIALEYIVNPGIVCSKICLIKCPQNCPTKGCEHPRRCTGDCYEIYNKNKLRFSEIAYDAKSVVCSRVSADQKAQTVRLMQEFDTQAITLSIGDGNNDVKMINQAHLGIGVYGDEGLRAVQCSDFAIGEFKILRRLILYHGRTNNVRISSMILYFFYKNFVFTLTHFYFAFYCNFTGQSIYDDWYITLYNLIFTSLPLMIRACLDHDVKPEDGKVVELMLPFLYQENRDMPIFTIFSFTCTLFRGIIHGLINFFFIVFIMSDNAVNLRGDTVDLWYISAAIFTNVVFVSIS
jgi:phospholipid-transporting ATPase